MLLHVVLFRPKADLEARDRESLVAAIERAHREISVIRRFAVGKRVFREASYGVGLPEYPFIALVELEDERDLQQYLQHPAHAELARWFWKTSDSALAYDFALQDAEASAAFLTPES